MELKPYQQQVINDLSLFLEQVQETKDVKNAFYNFWTKHPKTPLFKPYSLMLNCKIITPLLRIANTRLAKTGRVMSNLARATKFKHFNGLTPIACQIKPPNVIFLINNYIFGKNYQFVIIH